MLKCVEGMYRDGHVQLIELPDGVREARVLVTFLPAGATPVDLAGAGISPEEAAELRRRLGVLASDWDRPEMSVYDELQP